MVKKRKEMRKMQRRGFKRKEMDKRKKEMRTKSEIRTK